MRHQTEFKIRRATPQDGAVVSKLLATSYPILLKYDYAPTVLARALPSMIEAQPALLSSGTYYLVELKGRVVAAGGWSWSAPTGGSAVGPRTTGHIRHVVCDHKITRRGGGRVLMAHIFETARAAGVTDFECFSTLTAVPFYVAVGFEEVCLIDVKLSPGVYFPAVHMRARLAPLPSQSRAATPQTA